MEGFLKKIKFNKNEIKGLPLFFNTIFFNKLTCAVEEKKVVKYIPISQCEIMRADFSYREISKTINHQIFKQNE